MKKLLNKTQVLADIAKNETSGIGEYAVYETPFVYLDTSSSHVFFGSPTKHGNSVALTRFNSTDIDFRLDGFILGESRLGAIKL